jgi:CheY-like chemotaxis protein
MGLRILCIKDSEDDTVLLLREIQKGGYDVQSERVQTSADLQDALARESWDLIHCDYSMPSMNALEALGILQKRRSSIDSVHQRDSGFHAVSFYNFIISRKYSTTFGSKCVPERDLICSSVFSTLHALR